MKKKIIKILCTLLVFGCVYCLYMESRYSMDHVVKADLTEAEILAKMPDIAISEKDYALEEYVLSLPEVQEALEKAKESEYGADIPEEKMKVLLSDWIPEGWNTVPLSAIENWVYLSFEKEKDNRIERTVSYAFCAEGSSPLQKSIGVYERNWRGNTEVKGLYQNLNGEITTYEEKHQWFWWLMQE